MKKLTSFFTMALLAATGLTFTACDEYYYDEPYYHYDDYGWDDHGRSGDRYDRDYYIQLAQTMRGQWEGTIHTKYYDDDNRLVEGNYFTDFQFDLYEANATKGRGLETDYDGDECVYSVAFTWEIDLNSGDIYLDFDDNRQMILDEYHVDQNKFTGSMYSSKTGEVDDFSLTRYTFANENNIFEAEEGAAASKAKVKKDAPKGMITGGGHKN
ncbi:MAG: hypothetical protein IKT00_08940 [Prevotella sp.]|nr:hypothetical protein [Prevotella sp.]